MDDRTERMYELMRKESNRLKTFQMNPPWPKDHVDIKNLARAGFFYAFNGDNVHCAFCRGQVCRWDGDDDPMAEHARHFATCPFIMGGEVGNEPIGEDPFPGPKRPRPYDVCGPFPSYPPTDPRSEEDQYIRSGEQGGLIETSTNDDQHRQQQAQADDPTMHSLQEQAIQPYSFSSQSYLAQQADPMVGANQTASHEAAAPNSLTGICKVCYINSIELVFLPCGHSVSCLACAQRLFNCPFCRETITTRIRTYLV